MPHSDPTHKRRRRIELGQPYRLSSLRPGTVVVREANRTPGSIVTGSPCCRRLVRLSVADLEWRIQQRAKGFHVTDYEERRCPGCGAHYRIRLPQADSTAALHLAATVEWEVGS